MLAVQIEPSEIILDNRSTNVPVRMTPLIVDPAGGGRR